MCRPSLRQRLALLPASLALAVLAVGPAAACLNGDREEANPTHRARPLPDATDPKQLSALLFPPPFAQAEWAPKVAAYEQEDPAAATFDDRNAYALALVYLGQYARAKAVWEALEAAQPGHYQTASNLGTADELVGDNGGALQWIRTGITRNPESHSGTEWLHVKILEAKLALAQDPQWLHQHTVLGLDFGPRARPTLRQIALRGNTERQLKLRDVIVALTYQLKERLKFVRTPDPVVASLLTDLGNALLVRGEADAALLAYQRAQNYGATGELLDQRIAYALKLQNLPQGWPGWVESISLRQQWPEVAAAATGLLLVPMLFVGWRRRQRAVAQQA